MADGMPQEDGRLVRIGTVHTGDGAIPAGETSVYFGGVAVKGMALVVDHAAITHSGWPLIWI